MGAYLEWSEAERMAWLIQELDSRRPLIPATMPMDDKVGHNFLGRHWSLWKACCETRIHRPAAKLNATGPRHGTHNGKVHCIQHLSTQS